MPPLDFPRDRPFYVLDAYGEVQHVEYAPFTTMMAPPQFGPFFGVVDSDGKVLEARDILLWSDSRDELEQAMERDDG